MINVKEKQNIKTFYVLENKLKREKYFLFQFFITQSKV